MAELDDLQKQLLGAFFEESAELLERLESGHLALDRRGAPGAEIHDIFRAAHSLKGAAGTFGFPLIVELAHVLENLLDGVRNDVVRVTSESTALLLEAVDRLRTLVAAAQQGKELVPAPGDAVLRQRLADAAPSTTAGAARPPEIAAAAVAVPGADASPGAASPTPPRRWDIGLKPLPNLLLTGNDPLRLLRELATLGPSEAACDASRLPDLVDLNPDLPYLSW